MGHYCADTVTKGRIRYIDFCHSTVSINETVADINHLIGNTSLGYNGCHF